MAVLTGVLFEEETLGKCQWVSNDYVPYKKAMDIVKKSQPWDPTDPEPRIASDLQTLVADGLEEDYAEVKFFTSVGSPLDKKHGVDAFIEWKGIVVTLDVTMNPEKIIYKADLVIQESNVYDYNGGIKESSLREIANDIIRLLKLKARYSKGESA